MLLETTGALFLIIVEVIASYFYVARCESKFQLLEEYYKKGLSNYDDLEEWIREKHKEYETSLNTHVKMREQYQQAIQELRKDFQSELDAIRSYLSTLQLPQKRHHVKPIVDSYSISKEEKNRLFDEMRECSARGRPRKNK